MLRRAARCCFGLAIGSSFCGACGLPPGRLPFWMHKEGRGLIYMPMVPEGVMAMLACARLGAVHSVVFGGFASKELAKRIDDAKPKVILAASCGLEVNRVVSYKPLLDGGIELSRHRPD